MNKSTWETCDKPGSARCRVRIRRDIEIILKLEQMITKLEDTIEELTRAEATSEIVWLKAGSTSYEEMLDEE
jgi:hypothetical protein